MQDRHPTLLAAIGRALGQDGPYRERFGERQQEIHLGTGWMPPRDTSLRVLGGAVDPRGRAAWIEEEVYGSEEIDQPVMTTDPETGELVETTCRETWVHSSIHLRAAEGGHEYALGKDLDGSPRVGLDVPSYNQYFGCAVGLMAWFGDVIVTLYREKHEAIVWAVPLRGEPALVTITSAVVVRGDELYFQGEEPGILNGLSLPDLAPLIPIPTVTTLDEPSLELQGDTVVIARPAWIGGTEDDVEVERVQLPEHGSPLDLGEAAKAVPRVIDWLMGRNPPRRSAELLAGAVLSPLYTPRTRVRSQYYDRGRGWSTPHWLPAYWHQLLVREGRHAEAEAHLAFLDAVAALPLPASPDRLFTTATRHVVQRARVLAEVCRTGTLPERWTCLFWPRTESEFRWAPPDGAPAGLVEAMEQMARHPPKLGDWLGTR